MPCFSATNLRLNNAQTQQKNVSKDRPQTAAIRKPSNTNLRGSHTGIPKETKRQCEEWFQSKGYNPRNIQKSSVRSGVEAQKTTLPQKELDRLKTASQVVSLEDRLDALKKKEAETKKLEEAAEETRLRFKKIDDARMKAAEAKVEKEDLFGAGEKVKVLERAFLAKHEQEEEVKRVNRIILNAKCHAVRDAQLQEKIELEKEQRNDELRLEKMVLERAIKSLNEEDEKFEKKKELKLKYATEIQKQLNERERLRFLEAERIEEEAKMMRKASEAIKRDEERQLQLKKECRNKFRAELAKIAEMSNLFKKMLCEQEREAEMRVAAYHREKEERERALKKEEKLSKEEFERKQQRLFTLAQKVLESKSQREEMSYIRQQEKVEREYRRKEKEAAIRKQQIEKELTEARERQLQEMKHRQALQIARAEQDFNNLTESLKQEEAKVQKQEKERECRRKCYRSDIIRQMTDKEMERRRLLDFERNQAFAWRESERLRDANIRAVINAKLAAMRDACLPEKYIKDVQKQLQKIANTRNVAKSSQ